MDRDDKLQQHCGGKEHRNTSTTALCGCRARSLQQAKKPMQLVPARVGASCSVARPFSPLPCPTEYRS